MCAFGKLYTSRRFATLSISLAKHQVASQYVKWAQAHSERFGASGFWYVLVHCASLCPDRPEASHRLLSGLNACRSHLQHRIRALTAYSCDTPVWGVKMARVAPPATGKWTRAAGYFLCSPQPNLFVCTCGERSGHKPDSLSDEAPWIVAGSWACRPILSAPAGALEAKNAKAIYVNNHRVLGCSGQLCVCVCVCVLHSWGHDVNKSVLMEMLC